MNKTGIYKVKEVNGSIACCYYDVIDMGITLYTQRFITGASNQRINTGIQYQLKEIPENWERVV